MSLRSVCLVVGPLVGLSILLPVCHSLFYAYHSTALFQSKRAPFGYALLSKMSLSDGSQLQIRFSGLS